MHHELSHAPRRCVGALAVVLLMAAGLTAPARAEDKKADSSLGMIPADAAYYGAMLRNREQFDAVAKSKAWTRIRKLPYVDMAFAWLDNNYSPTGKLAPLQQWAEQQENRDLLALLGDAVSDEIFCYGGGNWVPFVDLYTQLNNAQRFGQVTQLLKDANDPKALSMAGPRAMLRVLARNPDKIKVPDLVLGFKIKDAKKAEVQIKRLEDLLNALATMDPMFQGRVKRVKIGGGDFLTLKLDGEMVPWDQIPLKEVEEAAGEFDGVVKNLKKLTLTIALGVRDDFLLLSIGAATDGLKQLGGEGPRLTGRAELKPLVAAANKRLTGISYSSKALRAKSQMSREDVDSLAVVAGQALEAAGIAAEKRKPIAKDIAGLAEDLKKNLPSVGASLSFSFLSERGYESFEYDRGEFPERDGSQARTLLNHLGGNPILAAVGRSKGALESYQTMSKWLKIAFGHAEPLLVEKLEKEQKEKYDELRKAFLPLLKQLDEVTSKMLLPALADGQAGFVLDAKWTSKQWHPALPPSEKPLPMPELGVLVGVSDSALLEKAMKSYRKIVEDGLAKAREVAPKGEMPAIKLPAPEVKTVSAGKLYVFHLPKEWQVDAGGADGGAVGESGRDNAVGRPRRAPAGGQAAQDRRRSPRRRQAAVGRRVVLQLAGLRRCRRPVGAVRAGIGQGGERLGWRRR